MFLYYLFWWLLCPPPPDRFNVFTYQLNPVFIRVKVFQQGFVNLYLCTLNKYVHHLLLSSICNLVKLWSFVYFLVVIIFLFSDVPGTILCKIWIQYYVIVKIVYIVFYSTIIYSMLLCAIKYVKLQDLGQFRDTLKLRFIHTTVSWYFRPCYFLSWHNYGQLLSSRLIFCFT